MRLLKKVPTWTLLIFSASLFLLERVASPYFAPTEMITDEISEMIEEELGFRDYHGMAQE